MSSRDNLILISSQERQYCNVYSASIYSGLQEIMPSQRIQCLFGLPKDNLLHIDYPFKAYLNISFFA